MGRPGSSCASSEALARLAARYPESVAVLRVEEDFAPCMAEPDAFLARLHHRTRTITLNGPHLAGVDDAARARARAFLIGHEWFHAVRAGVIGDDACRRDAASLVGAEGSEEAAADRVGEYLAEANRAGRGHDV